MYTVEGCSSGACQCYCASDCGPHRDQAGVNLYSFNQVTPTITIHPPTAATGMKIFRAEKYWLQCIWTSISNYSTSFRIILIENYCLKYLNKFISLISTKFFNKLRKNIALLKHFSFNIIQSTHNLLVSVIELDLCE